MYPCLWKEPLHIPGEQDAFPYVRQVQHLRQEPVDTDTPTAVRGHTVFERIGVEGEIIGVEAELLDPCNEPVESVFPLSTG